MPERIRSARPEELSAIATEFGVASVSDLYRQVLVVSFSGKHRAGAAGAPDSRAMHAQVAMAVTLWTPDALIVDLSRLDYPGGDRVREILKPIEPVLQEGFPLWIVASAANRPALEHAFAPDVIVTSSDEALARIATAGPWALR
jgi:hypothetical protein